MAYPRSMRKTALERLQEGQRSKDRLDSKDFSFYDTIVIDNAVQETYMFTIPVSQQGKTFADTNMIASGQIPQGKKHIVHALKFFYKAAPILVPGEIPTYRGKNVVELMELFDFIERTVIDIYLDGKDTYGQYTLQEAFGLSTLLVAEASNALADASFRTQPEPFYKGVLPVNVPIHLPAMQIFKVIVRTYGAIALSCKNDKLKISLNGFLLNAQ